MKCKGAYKHHRQEYDCENKWGCKNYSFRVKPKREVPISGTKECEHFKQLIETT